MIRQLVFVAVIGAVVVFPQPGRSVVCSVFSRHPCIYRPYHQVCSVFRPRACTPEPNYPFSDQLQLTIESRSAADILQSPRERVRNAAARDLRTLSEVFKALRGCWVPPAEDRAKPGTELSVRFSFNRAGEILGQPRITYITPGSSRELRQTYWESVVAALHRCTPLAFSQGLGGALAGRPFAIRFVDNRQRS
jgi:hypothetical protein